MNRKEKHEIMICACPKQNILLTETHNNNLPELKPSFFIILFLLFSSHWRQHFVQHFGTRERRKCGEYKSNADAF